ncbi:short chain dehydrogenase/reductase-like protein [Calycina marina]|uniref:Short chain dehydrogenase/reductase-like protein n=1 Tax=Calycina marina TaxID=1763456 RepID=A0A9P7YXE8_9HELO|nr:short chain dehydrogenase/reductase-like protein [Calycina marina]
MESIQRRKTVFITGCSPGGIGHSLAEEFHKKGSYSFDLLYQSAGSLLTYIDIGLHVIASARSRDTLKDLEELGISTVSLEVTNAESREAAGKEIEKLTDGKLDILVNNAGRNLTLPAMDVDLDEARDCFEVNFIAVVAVTQILIPQLIAAKGLILNVGSIAGIVPYVFGSIYNATKAALHSWSSTLRLELEPFNVRVMVVVTGGVQSRIARNDRQLPEGSLYLPINAEFQRRVKHSQEVGMPNQNYAKSIVASALKKRPSKWVWQGAKSWQVWFVANWLGAWVFDILLPRMFGLVRLKALLRMKGKIE